MIDRDLWEQTKNPIKFLKIVSQEKIEEVSQNDSFLQEYNRMVKNFDSYMNSSDTWFDKNYPNNKEDLIAYFSAEYGLDEIIPIYSGRIRNFVRGPLEVC